ncbi:hypothetical protein MOQ_005222 [Trypanosoma cruzi marinkellei]|uniref:Uncharacterized protein n=1 Tax=Trypanosoma cruzi marinkellei TaxID=85056 RepID=K2M7E2_TRYCR|nr:hypothetical protein MOQ_005222 [Trypanosoma cruzi marinkellei]
MRIAIPFSFGTSMMEMTKMCLFFFFSSLLLLVHCRVYFGWVLMTFVFEARRLPFGDAVMPPHGINLMSSGSCGDGSIDEARLVGLPAWKKRLLPPVLDVVLQHYGSSSSTAVSCGVEAELLGWTVALRIVEELPELETAYSRILEYRERQRTGDMTAEELMMEELLRERMGKDFLAEDEDESSSLDEDDDKKAEEVDIAMCFTLDGEVVSIGSANLFGGHGYHEKMKS